MAKRVDSNQAEIVAALRKAGATVQDLHTIGKGCPDILVGYHGKNYIMEIKTAGGKFTKSEIKWHENWEGNFTTVSTSDSALWEIGAVE